MNRPKIVCKEALFRCLSRGSVVRFRPLQRRSRGLLLLAAALAAGALLAGSLARCGHRRDGTRSARTSRRAATGADRAAADRARSAAGSVRRGGVARPSAGRAGAPRGTVSTHSPGRRRRCEHRSETVQRSLTASQERVVRTLRELYIYGEVDPTRRGARRHVARPGPDGRREPGAGDRAEQAPRGGGARAGAPAARAARGARRTPGVP